MPTVSTVGCCIDFVNLSKSVYHKVCAITIGSEKRQGKSQTSMATKTSAVIVFLTSP